MKKRGFWFWAGIEAMYQAQLKRLSRTDTPERRRAFAELNMLDTYQ